MKYLKLSAGSILRYVCYFSELSNSQLFSAMAPGAAPPLAMEMTPEMMAVMMKKAMAMKAKVWSTCAYCFIKINPQQKNPIFGNSVNYHHRKRNT